LIGSADQNIEVTKKLLKLHDIVIADHDWSLKVHKNNEANQKSTSQLMQLMEYTIIDSIENLFVESTYFNQCIDNLVFQHYYHSVKDPLWPCCPNISEFHKLPVTIRNELATFHHNNRVEISKDLTTVKICRQSSLNKEKSASVEEQIKHYSSSGLLQIAIDPLIKDIELWGNILQRFNSNGSSWGEISWLR
jgi:RNAse (barnase) inhibitor barstar